MWSVVEILFNFIAIFDKLIFLRCIVFEQNAAILITQQENDRLTFSTFRLSLPSEKVMSNCSTFASSYPTNTVTTPKSKLLTSKALVRQLADLNEGQ